MMSVEVLKNRNGRPGREEVPCRMQWGVRRSNHASVLGQRPKTFNPHCRPPSGRP